jgi:hypothetical protein
MPHDFILQHITISISNLSKYFREKKNKKQKRSICTGWYLHPVQMPPYHVVGWRAHLYGPRLRPVQMCGICTGYFARYKCSTTFVPDGLYRFNTRYK